MSNRLPSFAGRFASLVALLGASTLVLAAAGESMWHANAAASNEGRWAAPAPEGEETMETTSLETAEMTKMATTMTAPVFKPFVMVRIPLPSGYSSGEVMGLNEAGQAVGWMYNDSESRDHAFFFDPAEGVTMLDLNVQQHDSSVAYSISNDATPVIAGAVMWKGSPNYLRACVWEGPTGSLATKFGTGTVSAAWDIDTLTSGYALATMYKVSGEERSRVWLESGSTSYYPAANTEGEALGINASGEAVGWHMVNGASHAYSWVQDTTTDIHPSGWDSSGATSINAHGDVAGWVVDNPNGAVPAYWYNTGQNFYAFSPFVSVGAASIVCGINNHGEMAITNTTSSGGGAIWQIYNETNVAFNLNTMTLMPDSTGLVYSARAINDNLWMGGSYKATSQSSIQPCLIIPYDVNNNGDPDYREIVNEVEPDTNGNWLIDWGENIAGSGMRVGLHAPGTRSNNWSQIANRQVSRQSMHLRHLSLLDSETYDESFPMDLVVAGGEACEEFEDAMENWGRGTVGNPRQGEIIIWLRSSLDEEDREYDYLPADATEEAEVLLDIHIFSYRYARCIDYIQTGNEVFGGGGQYRIRSGDLEGWTWPGDPKTLGEIRDDEDLGVECLKDAVQEILRWLKAQQRAVVEGSGLAGRPLRMIGPGIPSTFVNNGYSAQSQDHTGRYLTTQTSAWCNVNQMYFDLHVHYTSASAATSPIERLTDTLSPGSAPWDVPNWLACLEVGPQVDAGSSWAQANSSEFDEFMACGTPAYDYWEDFVDSWQSAQWSTDPSYGLDDALAALAAVDFTLACYGPTVQTQVQNGIYDIAAIRATNVCTSLIQDPSRFTELKIVYQDEAYPYQITNFVPHPSACSGCPQQ